MIAFGSVGLGMAMVRVYTDTAIVACCGCDGAAAIVLFLSLPDALR